MEPENKMTPTLYSLFFKGDFSRTDIVPAFVAERRVERRDS
jgi:hypothetical protein